MQNKNLVPGTVQFTIILPVGEDITFLERTLRSCINQSQTDLEILVVYLGHEHDVWQVVEPLRDERIVVLEFPGKDIPFARNRGLEHARGEYVLFLECYHEIQALWLEKALQRFRLSHADAVQCATIFEEDNRMADIHIPNDSLFGFHQRLLFKPIVPLSSMVVRRSACARFPEDKPLAGDWEFWIETLRNRKVDVLADFYGSFIQLQHELSRKSTVGYAREQRAIMDAYYPQLRVSLRKLRRYFQLKVPGTIF
jgi:glycosyltransferase involved in cell wall biosynthesis